MSNKNNDNTKQKRLTEKQRLEKEKKLLYLKKEIKELESQIKYGNAKIYALRGLKILLRTGQLIAPFAVTAGITIGGFAAFGLTPFYRDKCKQKLQMMKELDSFGNIRYEQQYDEYENSKNTILVIGTDYKHFFVLSSIVVSQKTDKSTLTYSTFLTECRNNWHF